LMGTVGTSAINTSLYKKLPYDALADFTPIATVAEAPVVLVAHPATPFKNVHDLVSRAKAAPNTVSYGSAGNGTPGHLAGAMFCTAAGIQLVHVPYRGSAPALTDLLGGQIPLMFDPLQSVLTHVSNGKLHALAVTSSERASVIREVPTIAESGWKGFETSAWWAVFAPARLPAEVTRQLSSALKKVVTSSDFANRLIPLGMQPMSRPLAEFQKSEMAKWGAAVRATGLSLD
jgi:tripartite-type tricarboxylate transporter receptor subunit TctC